MKKLTVNIPDNNYEVLIGENLLAEAGSLIRNITSCKKAAIVSDSKVASIYGTTLINSLEKNGFQVKLITFPPGESSKSLEELQKLYDELLEVKITRTDIIIALGGGVTGDLTGLAAATLLRGIPYVQIPTTLLAQVDSSIGGKVAIDLKQGKNLVGAFYHPKLVIIDRLCLNTLEQRFLNDGMGEVIKYGAISDKELFEKLLSFSSRKELLENMEDIIYTCCNIKREIVEKDPFDKGERMLLNFGHTLGHGIEKAFNYSVYTHGEAVSIGMYLITKISEALGVTELGSAEKIKVLLENYSLPFNVDLEDKAIYKDALALDKKGSGGDINIILLSHIGEAFIYKLKKSEFEKTLEK